MSTPTIRDYQSCKDVLLAHFSDIMHGYVEFTETAIPWGLSTDSVQREELFEKLRQAYQKMCGGPEMAQLFGVNYIE